MSWMAKIASKADAGSRTCVEYIEQG